MRTERDEARAEVERLKEGLDAWAAEAVKIDNERKVLTAQLATVVEALESARRCLTASPRDWAATSRDAWLWGLLVGWGPESINEDLKSRCGWSPDDIARLGRLRLAIDTLDATNTKEG